MITTRLNGGLGNQMFQYAAARALALRHGTAVGVDCHLYKDYPAHGGLHLDCFKMSLVDATLRCPRWLCKPERHLRLLRWTRATMRRPLPYVERTFSFDPAVLGLADGSYLVGLWQSERYFADWADIIRQDFEMRDAPCGRNRCWLGLIGASRPAVSIHVRRGDYATSVHHAPCSLDYYREALRLTEEKLRARSGPPSLARPAFRSPRYFVFSDEPEWARAHLASEGEEREMHFVQHNDATLQSHEDLRLMRACDHHIIGNSTFSWWAAWLNPSPDKIVVAPTPWFPDGRLDTSDLLPEAWLTAPSGLEW